MRSFLVAALVLAVVTGCGRGGGVPKAESRVEPDGTSPRETLPLEASDASSDTYRVPIDEAILGIPLGVPPGLYVGDSLGVEKLNSVANQAMPKAIELLLPVDDVRFAAGRGGFYIPTLVLGPRAGGREFKATLRGVPCILTLAFEDKLVLDAAHEYALEPVGEADARRIAALEGEKVRLHVDCGRLAFRSSALPEALDLTISALHAEVDLPPGTIESAEPDKGQFRLKCGQCGKVFTSALPPVESPGFEPEPWRVVACPACHSKGPFVELARKKFRASEWLDTGYGKEQLERVERMLIRSKKPGGATP